MRRNQKTKFVSVIPGVGGLGGGGVASVTPVEFGYMMPVSG